jgi:hypothetical protein
MESELNFLRSTGTHRLRRRADKMMIIGATSIALTASALVFGVLGAAIAAWRRLLRHQAVPTLSARRMRAGTAASSVPATHARSGTSGRRPAG